VKRGKDSKAVGKKRLREGGDVDAGGDASEGYDT